MSWQWRECSLLCLSYFLFKKKFSEDKKTQQPLMPPASLSFQRSLSCIFSILSFAKCNKIMTSSVLKDHLIYDSQKAPKQQVLFTVQFFTATNFTLISSCIFSPTFLQCKYRGCSTFLTLWAWQVSFPLLTIQAQSLTSLQLHQHPKSETQPYVCCTGQFRWWLLCTVEATVTP